MPSMKYPMDLPHSLQHECNLIDSLNSFLWNFPLLAPYLMLPQLCSSFPPKMIPGFSLTRVPVSFMSICVPFVMVSIKRRNEASYSAGKQTVYFSLRMSGIRTSRIRVHSRTYHEAQVPLPGPLFHQFVVCVHLEWKTPLSVENPCSLEILRVCLSWWMPSFACHDYCQGQAKRRIYTYQN